MILVYNHMNLPVSVTGNGRTVNYLYDALGTKLRKTSSILGQHDYVGGIEYKDGKINLIHTGEGTAHWVENGEKYVYQYHLKDHLGNVRSVIYRNPTTGFVELLQQDDYFPFGKRYVVRGGDNHYLYNGKEMQPELTGGTHLFGSSLSPEGQLDYGARFYDPEIGRWNVVDSLAGKFQSFSPYNYAVNNPMSFIDPDGKAISIAYHKKSQPFIFNGANHSQAPGHWKVQTFLQAYNYLIKNGTGSEIRQLAESKSIMVNLNVSSLTEQSSFVSSNEVITWNPFLAKSVATNLRPSATLSPATLLEHEAGHAMGYYNNPVKYKSDGTDISGYKYKDLEEYRIASTVEKQAAYANGEFLRGEMRSGYGASKQDFWVKSPTSNGPQYLFEKVYYEIHGKSVQSYFPQLSIINTSPGNSMLYFQGK